MQKVDYSIFYKHSFSKVEDLNRKKYDIVISCYNNSARVKTIFDAIQAPTKHWLIFPEYMFMPEDLPHTGKIFKFSTGFTEADTISEYFSKSEIEDWISKEICVDITGFIRPHLIFFVLYIKKLGVKKVDFIYTDPNKYIKKEETLFSTDSFESRQINGCEGTHSPDTSNDYLIIGAGYDYNRINDIVKFKNNTTKVHLFGFPSLQPDMYQENILKASNVIDNSASKGDASFLDEKYMIMAPANDPFITAQSLQEFISKRNQEKNITNLYLSPLSTKAQTLGFALYYSYECQNKPVSIIFPFSKQYNKETTEGISKIWKYTVEF
ncbi:hypothetical protein [Flectobacillus rivi]|uniref:Uncharacterized protein n=1 Tax=Flectobacillus rivi TaxID=2984209 RepID=A0ABT6YVR2_9BACT|nr:hypothetical protein [Flectobacillus rivi]MDI9872972.1 hypothetical protein [Flectobacillus rivi]